MILGVPTLNRYDLLEKLIRSALRGLLVPDKILVVDNGGSYENKHGERVEIIYSGPNIGVAAAWNRLLRAGAWVISNDDVELGPETFARFLRALEVSPVTIIDGRYRWSLFGQRPEVTEKIGFYDEAFFPAYYEDNDYEYRLKLAGIVPTAVSDPAVTHVGWASSRDAKGALRDPAEHSGWYQRNLAYYQRKWGGPPGKEILRTPFIERSISVTTDDEDE